MIDSSHTPAAHRTPDELLRESEERFRAVWEATSEAIALSAPDGVVLAVNPAYCTLYGYSMEELVGRHFAIIYPESARADAAEQYRAIFADPLPPTSFEARVQRADGSERVVEARADFIVRDGERVAMVSTLRDITDRYLAEAALGTNEARYRALFETMDEGFCIIDVFFDDQGEPFDYQFVEANPAVERHTGLHDVTGKRMRDLAPDLETFWYTTYGRVAATGEPERVVHQAEALGGRWFNVYAFRMGGDESRRVAVVFTDITERKRLEQSQQDFIAMASHDLAGPVTVLRARAQLMRRRKSYDEESVDAIIEQTGRMDRLLNDLRELVQLEAGRLPLNRQSADLASLVREAMERAQLQTTIHQLSLTAPAEPVIGAWDRNRLEQILDNLLGNAIKYSPRGGAVAIEIALAGDQAHISITDEGRGIEAEEIPRLFERFYRGHQVSGATGLGFGLYITRMLVEAHGGSISAASAPGVGSTFTLTLPLLPPPASEDRATERQLLSVE